MSFEGYPHFLIGMEVRAKRATRSAEIRIAAAGGASLFVPEGHWVFVEGANAYELPDEDFRARFAPVPPDARSFVERGRPCRAVACGAVMRLEGRDPMPLEDFLGLAVRVGQDGAPICRVSEPLWRQAEAVIAAGHAGRLHLEAIRAQRAQFRNEITFDPQLAADRQLLDMMLDPARDRVSNGMATLYAARPPAGMTVVEGRDCGRFVSIDPSGLRGILLERAGIPPEAVIDVTMSPLYRNQGIRAFARTMLAPYLGDTALEDTVLVPIPTSDQGDEIRSSLERWIGSEAELIIQGPPASSPSVPGYETSPMRHYRLRDADVELCAFDDAHAFYVYAWKAGPRPGLNSSPT